LGSSDPDGSITSYAWSFGDGSSGTGATTNHTYATSGTFTVTLAVTDNLGARGTDTATVTVSTAASGGSQMWASRLGGAGSEVAEAVATAANGDVVMTGYFSGTTNIAGTPVTSVGNDIFVARYNSAGVLLW